MIDVEAESEVHRQRSADLAAQLDECCPTVDTTGIRSAKAEARRLGEQAHQARWQAAAMIKAGQDPGVPIGREAPIRKIPASPDGRDPDPILRGRSVISPELIRYWTHQRDVVAQAIVDAHHSAAEQRSASDALLAAVAEHISRLRIRRSFHQEGGEELHAAHERYLSSIGICKEGVNEGERAAADANAMLESLRGEVALAQLGDMAGTENLDPFIAGRISQALHGAPIDSKTMQPLDLTPTKNRSVTKVSEADTAFESGVKTGKTLAQAEADQFARGYR